MFTLLKRGTEPADRVNPKPRHFSIHKSWVIHIIIWYFFLITLISSAKQCYLLLA